MCLTPEMDELRDVRMRGRDVYLERRDGGQDFVRRLLNCAKMETQERSMNLRLQKLVAAPGAYPGFGPLLAAWTLLGCAGYARNLFLFERPAGSLWSELLVWLTGFLPWVLLSPVVFRLEQKYPLQRLHLWKHLVWLALASVPLTWASCKVAMTMTITLRALLHLPQTDATLRWAVLRCEASLQQALYWLTVFAAYGIRKLHKHQESQRLALAMELERSQLENSLRRTELENMRMRLNPHFLFNCLQNISTLTHADPDTASRMLTRLGDVLRSVIGKGMEPETTLASEIELTKAYAAIEQMRFQDRLILAFDVEDGLDQTLVPTFLLQPLVENAIRHGLQQKASGVVRIRAFREQRELALTVTDDGSGISRDLSKIENGIGLGATSARLERMYPGLHSFSIKPMQGSGTEVRITIPLRRQYKEAGDRELVAAADRG